MTCACPRCAYDLSGEIARWQDECPTSGTCPECGLSFGWAAVLNPRRGEVPGFVEHSRGVFPTIAAAWRTWWWTARPAEFWRRIGLEAPLRPWRWCVWFLVVFVGSRIAACVIYAAAAAVEYATQFASTVDLLVLLGDGAINSFFRGIADVRVGRAFAPPGTVGVWYSIEWRLNSVPPFLFCIPVLVLTPLIALLLMRGLRRAARVRTGHVVRAWVYSLAWLLVPLLLDVINSIRVFTRCKTGALIFDDWMPNPRSSPDWPRLITDRAVPIALVLMLPLVVWLTMWWREAIHSWRLVTSRELMKRLAWVWAGVVVLMLAATLVLVIVRA